MASEFPDRFTADQQQQPSSTSSCTLCPGSSRCEPNNHHWLADESSGLAPCCSSTSPTPSPSSVSTSTSTSSFFFGGGGAGGSEGELSEGGGMTVRGEERSGTVPVVRKPIGTSATGYGVLEEPGRYRGAAGGRATPGKTSEKTMRSTEARPCRTLKEYNSPANYPWTIRLPDGEERNPAQYKNFRLQTPDPERALLDNVISAPPNVTVDASVCENMSWNGTHRCQGGPCPPPYGSLHQSAPCHGMGGAGPGDINLKKDAAPDAAASPSKSGKLKEVLSSFVRSMVPSSGRASCRKTSGGSAGGVVAAAEPRPSAQRWNVRRPSPPMGGGTAGGPGFDPPPSYERVVKEKKEQENAKKSTPPK